MHTPKNQGFTLIELLVALAIIGILFAVAMPRYSAYVQRANRSSDGFAILNNILQAQERFYSENQTYTTDLTDLGFGSAANLTSGDGHYKVSATACAGLLINQCVVLTATAQNDQVNDQNGNSGNISINSQGIKVGW